jgi:hypothetical protein
VYISSSCMELKPFELKKKNEQIKMHYAFFTYIDFWSSVMQ